MKRRQFLQSAAMAAGATLLPDWALAGNPTSLVILHTNDTHSRIDPFPMDGGRNQGLGGTARRLSLLKRIRAEHPHVLLLDSGDIFQGTPYFNFFKGKLELQLMSEMRYDVGTLGNHDFDNGVQGFANVMEHAKFQFVCANYEFAAGNPMKPRIAPYTIREVAGIKIGIFGLGIDFDGLVLEALHEGVTYHDPIAVAQQTTDELRRKGCSMVICLSHLGYKYSEPNKPSDQTLAQNVRGIDLILGGHTHTFLDTPQTVNKGANGNTIINQVGFAGIRLGRFDVSFDRSGAPKKWASAQYEVNDRIA